MGLKGTIIALVFIGLFTFALIGFAMNFAIDNDAPVNLADDPNISLLYTETSGDLSSFDDGGEDTYSSIVEASIGTGGQTTATGGQFAITPTSAIKIVKNILEVGYLKIFGTGSGFGLFLTTFIGMLVFIIALYVWKAWAGRNPD